MLRLVSIMPQLLSRRSIVSGSASFRGSLPEAEVQCRAGSSDRSHSSTTGAGLAEIVSANLIPFNELRQGFRSWNRGPPLAFEACERRVASARQVCGVQQGV
jgi:hypothetical protein